MRQMKGWAEVSKWLSNHKKLQDRQQQTLSIGLNKKARKHFCEHGYYIQEAFLPQKQLHQIAVEFFDKKQATFQESGWMGQVEAIPISPADLKLMPFTHAATVEYDLELLLRSLTGAGKSLAPLFVSRKPQRAPTENVHSIEQMPDVVCWVTCGSRNETSLFSYIPQSHRITEKRMVWEQRRYAELQEGMRTTPNVTPEDLRELSSLQPHTLTLKPNTLVLIDPFGFYGWNALGPGQVCNNLFMIQTDRFFRRFSAIPFEVQAKNLLEQVANPPLSPVLLQSPTLIQEAV
ncbi:hypothetical protein [Flexibacterium corallicola]|uniref:hypothetical protein n=1 Tax=Flexibacterium corallicola TaxID=3037259 RepID=UPI00286F9892|nr:hypothetical protein [Pseudovibrio sp. M1P-2-3]